MFFNNKKVLIIGGTGTIGQSLLTYILKENPSTISIFSRDEYKQFKLKSEKGNHNDKIRYIIGDIRNYSCVYSAMEGMDYVFHVAAMKHVTFCEENPYEAALTNIVGTQNVIKAAIAQKIKKVVFTSSDKAISPTNSYGATKLIAERLISSSELFKGSSNTIFSCVRFGNVMGSRGSVIPLFVNQIRKNKKITLTDSSTSRFMMTLEQATKLTVEAMKVSTGGEIFILKMPVILLKDLAYVVMKEASRKYNILFEEIEIEEIGLRPGEKRYEELMTYEESISALELPNMFIIPQNPAENKDYKNIKKAQIGNYQSDKQNPISMLEIQKIIQSEKLI
ncbi:polysaccharide biosynthesis protein [Priestia megaterium]|uniref:polysaccharide biosynthesis protein n=1 Tax=Priestia megaterium TaxID=1404 RepID=UPI0030F3EF2A